MGLIKWLRIHSKKKELLITQNTTFVKRRHRLENSILMAEKVTPWWLIQNEAQDSEKQAIIAEDKD